MLNVDYSFLVTVLYVIILYLFLDQFFFGPIKQVLSKRRELIEGRLEDSRRRVDLVEQKTAEYEDALRIARTKAYGQQELQRELALAEKSELVGKAKSEAEKVVAEGHARIAQQAETARKQVELEVDALAMKLTTAILRTDS